MVANLSTPGASYGGWESPNVEVRGQFIGHYLSALAFAGQNTGVRARGEGTAWLFELSGVAGLAKGLAGVPLLHLLHFPPSCDGPWRMQAGRS